MKKGSIAALDLVTSNPVATVVIDGRERRIHGLTMRQVDDLIGKFPELAGVFGSRLEHTPSGYGFRPAIAIIAGGLRWSIVRTLLTARLRGDVIAAMVAAVIETTMPDTDPFFPTIKPAPKKPGEKAAKPSERVKMNDSADVLVHLRKIASRYGRDLTPGQLMFRYRSDEETARRDGSFSMGGF